MSMLGKLRQFWNREVLTGTRALTSDYSPGALRPSYWWYNQLPPFTLFTADWMLQDPQVRFGLKMLNGPMYSAEIEVECDDKAVKAFIEEQWNSIWSKSAKKLLRAKRYGYAGYELMYRIKEGRVVFDRMKDLHPYDTRPLTYHGNLLGLRVKHVRGELETGHIDIGCPKSLWIIHDREFGKWFGYSIFEGAYEPWFEKRMRGGGNDLRKLRMMKDAWSGETIEYPPERTYRVPDGAGGINTISARDLAREMLDLRSSGGTRAVPQSYTSDGQKEWAFTPPTNVSGVTPILEYVDKLDWEIWKGIGLPKEVVEAAESGSGYAGRTVPFLAFLTSRDEEFSEIVEQIDAQVLRPLTRINFAAVPDYRIRPKPLVESMKLSTQGGDDPAARPTQQMPPAPQSWQNRGVNLNGGGRPMQFSAEENAEDETANAVINRGIQKAGIITRDFQKDLLSRLKKNGLDQRSLADIDDLVDEASELLNQSLGETIFAAHVLGAQNAAEAIPTDFFQEVAIGPPPKPPRASESLSPGGDDEPFIRFPGLDNAINNLTERQVLAPEDFYRLGADARAKAFTITADITSEARNQIRNVVTESAYSGGTVDEFIDQVREALPGTPISDGHLEQVFRNNINTAYSVGMNRVLDNPIVESGFPYRAYYAIHDAPRVRSWHLALETVGIDGTNVFHKDDPTWRMIQPPNDFNCRCGWAPLSIRDAAALGVREAVEWRDTGMEPAHMLVKLPDWILEHFAESSWRNG